MNAEEIQKHLRRQPFVPIRIYLSDGATYDVPHPEFAYVSRRELVVAKNPTTGSLPEESAYCDPLHVTRIEPINGAQQRRQGSS